uniref:DNA 3'-5' helicase n=1 Tax=Elaeophora elaphi TaxID=1147741 RepID=A0A158Q7M7_9BILA
MKIAELMLWFVIPFVHFAMAMDNVFLGDSIYYAVNCGGLAHTDLNGIHYQADPLHVGIASDFGSRLSIMRVDPRDAILYQTERYHTEDFSYTVPLPKDDGEYTLVLKFCEVYFQSSQQKVFDVLLNDEVVIAELDIFKEAEGIGVAYDRLLTFHLWRDSCICVGVEVINITFAQVENGVMIYGDRRDSSGYVKITLAKAYFIFHLYPYVGVLDNPKINAFYIYRGPKTDIPPLQDVSFDEEIEEEEGEEEFDEAEVKLRSEVSRFEDEPLVKDPYAEQDTSHMFIPYGINPFMDTDSVPPANALRLLKKFFGHNSFRPLQWPVIQNAIRGKDQIVVMSTGYGKSVCYQLPSLYTEKLTVVISPLISLMNDQVENARSNGIQAACISGETNSNEQRSVLASDDLRVLYITPEFALRCGSMLKQISKNINLLAVDEAHCVSEWGHEFRPNYRQLAEVRGFFGKNVPVMALTATATQQVRMDIASSLELHQPIITLVPLDRPNLYLSVRTPTSLEGLLDLLIEDERNGKHFNGSTIIYCSTRILVDEVYECLLKKGVLCARYHAGMSAVDRRKAHECFIKDRITTIIATVAFGMGIDKPDVRNVIHYGAPKNMESYYQEIGRAGRDGFPSKCIVFYKDQELTKHRYCILGEQSLKEQYKKHLLEMLSLMERFLHATSCRRFMLLSHFDECVKKEVTSAGCCDICDQLIRSENSGVDRSLINSRNYGDEALILLRAVNIFGGSTGLGKAIDFVKGKTNVSQAKQKSEYYGSGKHKTEVFWKELGRILRMNGYITETKSSFNNFAHLISLSDKGQNWLYGKNRPFLNSMVWKKKTLSIRRQHIYFRILNFTKQREWKDCDCYGELIHSKDTTIATRTDLAMKNNCSAHIIASNKCVQQLAVLRPSCVQNLSIIGEMTEERQRKFGQKFVDKVVEFCTEHNISMDCTTDSALPKEIEKGMSTLNEACTDVYRNHVRGKLSLGDLAKLRAISEGTTASYFVNFVKNGLPIYLSAVGLKRQHIDTVYDTIREHGSDISRLKPIMEALPKDFIDYNRLKIIFAILEYEYGVAEDSEKSSWNTASTENTNKRNIPEWMKTEAPHSLQNKRKKKSNLLK